MNEIISAAVLLILIMDPLGNLPIFMSVLKHTEPKRRRAIMVRELLIALLVMLVFLFAGEKILAFLSLRAETVSISGGIILFLIAIKMIFPSASENCLYNCNCYEMDMRDLHQRTALCAHAPEPRADPLYLRCGHSARHFVRTNAKFVGVHRRARVQ